MRCKTNAPRRRISAGAIQAITEILEPRRLLSSTVYVDQNATGGNTGADWADAFTTLQAAFAVGTGQTIDVAQGTYVPTTGSAPTASFQLPAGASIFGGFAGDTTSNPGDRNVAEFPTILAGNGAFHVVVAQASNVLDGLTITGGNADGTVSQIDGGGVYASNGGPAINDCTFVNNTASDAGGALFEAGGAPAVTNCTFTNNTAINAGGAVFADNSTMTLTDCVFTGNSSSTFGGAVFDELSAPKIVNCLFTGNSASLGGGIYDEQSSPSIINCTFTANTATSAGGAMTNDDAMPTVTNCILYGDGAPAEPEVYSYASSVPTITYTDLANDSGTGDVAVNPLFVASNNFALQSTSLCVNAGSNAALPSGITTDLSGNPRIVGTTVDMGAYENQIIDNTWTGAGDGVSWNNPANWSNDSVPDANTLVKILTDVTVQLGSGDVTIASLRLKNNATLDLGTATLSIDYSAVSSADPISFIASFLTTGYNGGAWNGSGITSSTVATANATQSDLLYSVGYADGSDGVVSGLTAGQIEIMPTLAGDAALQGTVGFGDFQGLAQHIGSAGSWDQGNFTYGSTITFGDFQQLAQNFGEDSAVGLDAVENAKLQEVSTGALPPALTAPAAPKSSNNTDNVILTGGGNDTILLS